MVYIKEVLPNPVGKDTEGEWIKVINEGAEAINLNGWSISDASGKTFYINDTISSKEELVFQHTLTNISLNNNGDTVILKNNIGETIDSLSYTNQVSDDEIVISNRFIQVANQEHASTESLEELAFVGKGEILTGANASPVVVALVLAIIAGAAVGFVAKKEYEK